MNKQLLITALFIGATPAIFAQRAVNPANTTGLPTAYSPGFADVASNNTGGSSVSAGAQQSQTPAGYYGGFAMDGNIGSGGRISLAGTSPTTVLTIGSDIQNSNQQDFNQLAAGGTGTAGVTNYFQYGSSTAASTAFKPTTTITLANTNKGNVVANGGGVSHTQMFIGAGTDAKPGQKYVFNVAGLTINKSMGVDGPYGGTASAPVTDYSIFVRNTTIDVTGVANFQNGRIYLGDATNSFNDRFVIEPGGSVAGGNANAFVDGNMQNLNTGVASKLFPLGDKNIYSPVTITPAAAYTTTTTGTTLRYVINTTGQFNQPTTYGTVEGNVNSKQTASAGGTGTPLATVSSAEFYPVTSDVPVGTSVMLPYNNFTGANYVTDPNTLTIAGYDNALGQWVNLGTSTVNTATGMVTTVITRTAGLTGITQLTLGSTSPVNPLPVTWLAFTANKKNNTASLLDWSFSTTEKLDGFDVMRSTDGSRFTNIGTVTAVEGTSSYRFTDEAPAAGANYYRIVATEVSGKQSNTEVRRLVFGTGATPTAGLYPNPVSGMLNVTIGSYTGEASVQLYNAAGQLISNSTLTVEGSALSRIDMSSYAAGTYMLTIRNAANGAQIATIPVIKN